MRKWELLPTQDCEAGYDPADTREKFESLCFKPTTERNLKHKAPSVRALSLPCLLFPTKNATCWVTMLSVLLLLSSQSSNHNNFAE